jgi:hypothetical protein
MASLDDIPPELIRVPNPAKFARWLSTINWSPVNYRRRLIRVYQENTGVKLSPTQIARAMKGALPDD